VGIRGTEVQFLAGTVVASFHGEAEKTIFKETMPGATHSLRLLTASTLDYFNEIVILTLSLTLFNLLFG